MRINLMTATLSPGDAIGNYCLTLRDLLLEAGHEPRLYADFIDPAYGAVCRPSADYEPDGRGILWYHYSIYADNLACIRRSTDYRIMDFHGIAPPHLLAGSNPYLADLCRRGAGLLDTFRDDFALCVVHSEYSRQVLQEHGYQNIARLPLVVDTRRYDGREDETLSHWLRRLDYVLFVGRVVAQKGVAELIDAFACLRARRPGVKLFIVGRQDLAPAYLNALERQARRLGLSDDILFAGHIARPAMLTSFYRHARCGVFLSEWESFCVPLVESMHFGAPVIVSRVPPLPEIAGDGGLVVDRNDPAAVAEIMDQLWADEARYEQLVRSAQRRAADFTREVLGRELAAVLCTVTTESAGASHV